jgi:hypothetical protein
MSEAQRSGLHATFRRSGNRSGAITTAVLRPRREIWLWRFSLSRPKQALAGCKLGAFMARPASDAPSANAARLPSGATGHAQARPMTNATKRAMWLRAGPEF